MRRLIDTQRGGPSRRRGSVGPSFRWQSQNLFTVASRTSLPLDRGTGAHLGAACWFRRTAGGSVTYEVLVEEAGSWSLVYYPGTGLLTFTVMGTYFNGYSDEPTSRAISYNIGTGSFGWVQVMGCWKQSSGRVSLWTGGVERTWNTLLAYERQAPGGFLVGGNSHSGSDARVRDLIVTDVGWTNAGDAWAAVLASRGDAFYRFRGNDTQRLKDSSGNAYHLTI